MDDWKLGNRNHGEDFIINEIRYKGSPGLYELMFLKIPNQDLYGDNDLAKYKAILLSTNAHKQKYLRDGQINANRSYKYANIIAKLFPTEHRETTKAKLTKTLTPKLSRRRIQSVIGSGWKKNSYITRAIYLLELLRRACG